MNDQIKMITRNAVVALVVITAISGTTFFLTNRMVSKTTNSPCMIDCRSIKPGAFSVFDAGDYRVKTIVPKGEGFTFGTFRIAVSSLGFISDPIERDGSLETAWVFDVNGDNIKDVVFVIRNAGSGSFVDIIVLESSDNSFLITHLPSIPTIPGYMGHDTVSIKNGSIIRSFPTYANRQRIRIDHQWTIKDGIDGKIPIKKKPDSNADPSGKTVELQFNYTKGQWEQV